MRYAVFTFIAFALGFACHLGISAFGQTKAAQIKKHWQAIDGYNDYMFDPQNHETIDGMIAVHSPPRLEPHLAALVAFGELEHADLILPNVPASREANRYWMKFVGQHNDIVYSLGNSSYVAFQPSGKQPLRLEFWYRLSAEHKIQELIRDLESKAMESGEQID